jgi:hypothetical protein
MTIDGRRRVVIDGLSPEIDSGQFPSKRAIGEGVVVRAAILADGRGERSALLRYRKTQEKNWRETPMKLSNDDCREAAFTVDEVSAYHYSIQVRVEHFKTWRSDVRKRLECETDNWRELRAELKSIVLSWIGEAIRVFSVDNPHAKPIAFGERLIGEVKAQYPNVIFLAEAFTRPKAMYRLAKVGFSPSCTYFTWRKTKSGLTSYVTGMLESDARHYCRPEFRPNTPDTLPVFSSMAAGRHTLSGRRFRLRFFQTTESWNYGFLDPQVMPARIFRVHRRMRREVDFDCFS